MEESENIRLDLSSYVDPNGRVFVQDKEIFRGIHPDHCGVVSELFEKGIVDKLVEKHLLVETRIVDKRIPGYGLVLHHRRIRYPSYCVEWPFSLLKKAALQTLDLSIELLQHGMCLQDAYPWNVFFEGTSPVYIDFTSIVRSESNTLWPAYQQFCRFFLFPLYLYKCDRGKVARLLLHDYIQGIDFREFEKLVPWTFKLANPLLYVKRIFPEKIGEIANRSEQVTRKIVSKSISMYADGKRLRSARQELFRDLIHEVESVRLTGKNTRWTNYYADEAKELPKKMELIGSLIERLRPESLMDVGCNTGEFSLAAARTGASVIAFDHDEHCVERLAQRAYEQKLCILPLIIDFTNPPPSFGWSAEQFPSAPKRFHCEMVLALALIHHLVFLQRQNFERIIEGLLPYVGKWLVIEFIAINDSYIDRWSVPFERFHWYTIENFENALKRYFGHVENFGAVTESRQIFLCAAPVTTY